ncbi:hypothetical protein EDB19DRAFT_2038564, partial [Suillus lakei]
DGTWAGRRIVTSPTVHNISIPIAFLVSPASLPRSCLLSLASLPHSRLLSLTCFCQPHCPAVVRSRLPALLLCCICWQIAAVVLICRVSHRYHAFWSHIVFSDHKPKHLYQ